MVVVEILVAMMIVMVAVMIVMVVVVMMIVMVVVVMIAIWCQSSYTQPPPNIILVGCPPSPPVLCGSMSFPECGSRYHVDVMLRPSTSTCVELSMTTLNLGASRMVSRPEPSASRARRVKLMQF